MRATFEASDIVRISGKGTDLSILDAKNELTPFSGAYLFRDPIDGSFVFTSYETGRRYRVTLLRGEMEADGAELLGGGRRSLRVAGRDGWEIAVEEMAAARPPYATDAKFEDVVAQTTAEFSEFVDAIAGWRTADIAAAELAVYVLWSASVEPAGFFDREAILMSKHWMDKVWSWDHAFNAIAIAPGLPDLALDQFLLPFDFQDSSGALPDSVAHSEILYNFVKPPIHGWAFDRMRERLSRPLSRDELVGIYQKLAAWTRFWLDHRTVQGRSLPFYQHGNDSGWDNATTFDADRVIESPDLAAFLVVQLDILARLADELEFEGADVWRRRSKLILAALLDELHDGDGFLAVGAHSGTASQRSSLLTILPILAAHHLPTDIASKLATAAERHLTNWGLATQRPDTDEYEPDGYWRGPIWAPSTLLVEDGLRRGGFVALADKLNTRFRRLCERSGFAENFDAITGEGLRDRAYTWTASVYLTLARDAVMRGDASSSTSGTSDCQGRIG